MWYSPNVLFLNLMYCKVQYNTANNNKNNYSAPVSRLWSGTGQRTSSASQAILAAGVQSSCMPDVLVSLFTNKIVKMLSHVVNVTLHSVSITWCKLWQQFGWQLVYWNAEGCTSYVCHISISKVQMYTLLYVGYWLKKTGYDSQLHFY